MKTESYPLYQSLGSDDTTPSGTRVARIAARNSIGEPRDYLVLLAPGASRWAVTHKHAHATTPELPATARLDWSHVEMSGAHRIVGPSRASR